MDCIFCKIVAKEIPANICFENENIIAFDDLNPQAPIHKLIIPKTHIAVVNDLTYQKSLLIGELVLTAKQLAEENNLHTDGYRLIFNCNKQGGQEIYHIHLHLLGGRQMTWPPG